MSTRKKYTTGGEISPFWIREKDERINNYSSNCTVTIQIHNDNNYEEKFNFLKRHSNTPENLELAMKIMEIDS